MASSSYNCFMPKIGERMEVMISHAEYDKDNQLFLLWGQFHLPEVEKIEEALAELQDVAQRKEHPRGQLRLGNLCLAKSIQDNQWHRASIQTATGNDVLAFYVDYGSTEFVPRSRIRSLDETLTLKYEAQATKLLLRGIQPLFVRGGIKPGTLDYLDRYVVNKVFLCEPMEHVQDAVYVKLYSGKRDLSAQFISDGFAEPALTQEVSSPVPVRVEVDVTELPVMGMDVGQRERVYVSHVVSPTQFWLQQEVVAVDLDDMMTDLQTYFGSESSHKAVGISHIVPYAPCVARFAEDNQFYRAQVVRSSGFQSCEVFFVDYGNTEEVSVSNLKALPDQFSKLPGAAIEAGLSGIDPASCSNDAATARFNKLTLEKILCVKADSLDGPKVMVSMVDPRSEMNLSIGEILIKEKLATRTVAKRTQGSPGGAVTSSSRSSSRASNSSIPSPRGSNHSAAKFRQPNLTVGSKFTVTVTDIQTSNNFACQLLSQAVQFENMSAILQEEYSTRDPRDNKLKNVHVGSVCCAQFSEDEVWYRAEVTKVVDMSVEVHFVDYGNTDTLPLAKVKQLDSKFLDLEVQSFRCQLEHVEEIPKIAEKMKAKFEELVGENELEARICKSGGSFFVVELIDKANKVNINKQLQELCGSVRPRSATRRSVGEEFIRVEPKRHEKMKVYVSNVESPNLFHCQPVKSAQDLQNMMDGLNKHIEGTAPASAFQPKLQAPCVAQYSDDHMWYRAIVTGLKRSGDVEVRFVDFGNHETLKSSSIRSLPSKFLAFPIQGIPCSLEDVPMRFWVDDDINKFSDMCGDTELQVEFGTRSGDNYEVKLVTETGLCINEIFQPPASVTSPRGDRHPPQRGSSPQGRGKRSPQPPASQSSSPREIGQFKERELKVGPAVDVYISHVENLFEVWCQPAFTTGDLESLMTKLDQKYSRLGQNQLAIRNPRLGMACVAQFQQDKNWYRAIVTNKQLNRVYVCFVDYGNFEFVPVSCIKEIDEEIMKIPVVAVKCSLRGAKDLEGATRVRKLRNLIDQVDCFSCKAVSTANGVFEVDITFDSGKSVVDILRKVPKEEAPRISAPAANLQTPPRGKRSESPRSPTSPKPATNTTFKGRSPPQPQRQPFQSKHATPSSAPVPRVSQQPKQSDEDWGNSSGSTAVVSPLPAAPSSTPAPIALKYIKHQEESVVLEEFIDVVVLFIESPANFWVQKADLCAELDALMDVLNGDVASGKLQQMKDTENGQLCVARSSLDSALYRARILKKLQDNVEVVYIDYGNKEIIPSKSILSISQELLKLPSQAIQCSLSGISKTGVYSDNVIDRFTALTMEKQLVAKPLRKYVNRLEVKLSDTSGDVDIDISQMTAKAVEDDKMPSLPPPEITEVECAAYVTQVQEDGSFYLQLKSSTDTLDQIHAAIQAAYAEEVKALTEAKPGTICCGLYSEDNEWYRGVVESVQESGEASVRFLDYGNSSLCSVKELKELLPQFLDKAAIAFKCELHDVALTGIPDIGITLEEMTLEKELNCHFHDKSMPCQVSLSEEDLSINAELRKKFDYQPISQPERRPAEAGTHWVFPKVEVGKKFEAYMSSVVSPSYFFCQPSSVTKELDDLMVEMQSVYSQASAELLLSAGDIPTGSLCAALFTEDNQWYRAEILKQEGHVVTVFFPDYGNTDVIGTEKVKLLQKKHSDLTLKAIGCSLDGIQPTSGTWSLEACEFFERETMDKPLLMDVVNIADSNPQAAKVVHRVHLLDMGMNVADKLVQGGFVADQNAAPESGKKTELEISSVQVFPGYPSYQLQEGSTEGVLITAVTSLCDFYVQLTSHADQIDDLSGKVDEFYKNNKVPSVTDVKVGTPCVAQFSEDEVWYRAVIGEVTEEDTVYVTFVDYGNGDSVPASSIKELKEEFGSIPVSVFKCRLAGIDEEIAKDEEKLEKFEELMEKETLVAKVFSVRDGVVDIQIQENGVSAAISLGLKEDLNEYQQPSPGSTPQKVAILHKPISNSMYPGYTSTLINVGTRTPIFLTSITSLSEFYIQHLCDGDTVANLTAEMDEHYQNNEMPGLESVQVDTICAAQFSEDEVWYRAQVTSINGEDADVLFVDYGNSDTVLTKSLKSLREDLKTTPAYALRCQLAGVDTSVVSEQILDKFQEYLDSERLQVYVVDCQDTILTVQILDNGNSIASSLGLEEDIQMPAVPSAYSMCDIPAGSLEPAYVTSITALNDFAIQLQKFEDAVADFTSQVDEFYKSNDVATVTSVSLGMPCVAKFADDGVWYRGRVHHLEENSAEVTFVDYGNGDLIEISQLKELHPNFKEQHEYSFQCRLAGIPEDSTTKEEVLNKFEEYLESETLKVRVINVQNGRLVVQLLDGDDSVAVKLGLTEDLTIELAGNLSCFFSLLPFCFSVYFLSIIHSCKQLCAFDTLGVERDISRRVMFIMWLPCHGYSVPLLFLVGILKVVWVTRQ